MKNILRASNTGARHTLPMINNSEWEHKAKRLNTEVANGGGQEREEDEEKERLVGHSEVAIARIRASFHGGEGEGREGEEARRSKRRRRGPPRVTVGAPQLLILLIKNKRSYGSSGV